MGYNQGMYLLLILMCFTIGLATLDLSEGCLQLHPFLNDMTGDGIYTVSDIIAQLKWLFYLPGNLFMTGIIEGMPRLGQFFELSLKDCLGITSSIVSVLSWSMIWLMNKLLNRL